MNFTGLRSTPKFVADGLRSVDFGAQGHEAEHVADMGRAAATATTGAVIVTKDEDFVAVRTLDPSGPPVVWLRFGNATKKELIDDLTPMWPAVVQAPAQREKLVEVG